MAKLSRGAPPKAQAAAAAPPGPQDFVVKELQTSADDAIKLAYGSLTMPSKPFLELFSKMGEEYLKFVAKRLQAQAGFVASLSECNNVEQMAKTEMTFFGKAAQDYAEQFDRMAEATHEAAKDAKVAGGAVADGAANRG